MAFIAAVVFCIIAAALNNVWVAIGGLVLAIMIQGSQFNWLHHHMHNPHEEEDL